MSGNSAMVPNITTPMTIMNSKAMAKFTSANSARWNSGLFAVDRWMAAIQVQEIAEAR